MSSTLEEGLSTLLLLQSMYPLPSELLLSPRTAILLDAYSAGESYEMFDHSTLQATLRVQGNDVEEDRHVEIDVMLPVDQPWTAHIRQPGWVTRAGYDKLVASLPISEADMDLIEYLGILSEALRAHMDELQALKESDGTPEIGGTDGPEEKLERVWFWFPSLSSKEKRRDLVDYTGEHRLTGFVLAGKPGLLCVEGSGREVDRYMSRIKAESWSDIPSYQKKVTERLRLPLDTTRSRCFKQMIDITDQIPHYGQYNHRGEMGEVRRLMEEWGVGDDFSKVVLQRDT